MISWADKEGKPASGQLEVYSTLTVGDLQKGATFASTHHTYKRLHSARPQSLCHRLWQV
jgi:hypothetical protein